MILPFKLSFHFHRWSYPLYFTDRNLQGYKFSSCTTCGKVKKAEA